MVSWQQCVLYQEIVSRADNTKEITLLNLAMPLVADVLKSAAPASLQFTLHDDDHSYRVAEMSAKLIGEKVTELSTYEIVILLLSCYCHDIGMSPKRKKVAAHYNWLLTGDNSILPRSDRDSFQNWLDTYRSGITAPVEANGITASGINVIDDAVAYYTRSKHNDWSEEFVRNELSNIGINLYPSWLEDLISLCKSHHEGLSELRGNRFNAKNVGSPSKPMNLRFLAAILRLADVMEFAPERTPDVVLRSRDVDPSSRIYWYKDHSISFEIDNGNHQLIFSAQTPNALIHKAVLMTADWVNNELALCATLHQENAFTMGVVSPNRRSVYEWKWPSRMVVDIRELPNTFLYIDGSFRPDTKQVLNLLSGTALYRQPIYAVRELVQNSLDAIREQIAYSRLMMDEDTPELLAYLQNLHRITLTFAKEEDGYVLICEDNGSGMTRDIIERQLLVSGSEIRGETRRLERAALNAGFTVERTGRFGIGVLSYFMLASELNIATRRSQEAGDHDGTGWKFSINGLDGFGELSKDPRTTRGTTVSLNLSSEVLPENRDSFFGQLSKFVLANFVWLPCKLTLRDNVGDAIDINIKTGWTKEIGLNDQHIVQNMLSDLRPAASDLATDQAIEAAEKEAEHLESKIAIALRTLNWTPPVETSLDGGSIVVRLSMSYFDLQGDKCVAFTYTDNPSGPFPWNSKTFRMPSVSATVSLHGILVGSASINSKNFHVDVDIRRNTDISVDRSRFIEPIPKDLNDKIAESCTKIWSEFLEENSNSAFNEINVGLSPLDRLAKSKLLRNIPFWICRDSFKSPSYLRQCSEPVCSVARVSYLTWDLYHMVCSNVSVEALPVGLGNKDEALRLHYLYGGGKLHCAQTLQNPIFGFSWNSIEDFVPIDGTVKSCRADFPLSWASVLAIRIQGRSIYNLSHPAISKLAGVCVGDFKLKKANEIDRLLALSETDIEVAQRLFISSLVKDRQFWVWVQQKRQAQFRKLFQKFVSFDEPLFVGYAVVYSDQNKLVDICKALTQNGIFDADYPKVPDSNKLTMLDRRLDKSGRGFRQTL